jgi:hypothetical protein
MTVPLTSTVIVLGTSAADSNACTGRTLPIILSYRECRPFHPCRLTQSQRIALERWPRANKPSSSLARNRNRIFATITIVHKLPRLRSIRLL